MHLPDMALPRPGTCVLYQPQAEALYKALWDAYVSLQAAHANYQEALAIAVNTDLSYDGSLALWQQGQAYGRAVEQYCSAVQRWLGFLKSVNI